MAKPRVKVGLDETEAIVCNRCNTVIPRAPCPKCGNTEYRIVPRRPGDAAVYRGPERQGDLFAEA